MHNHAPQGYICPFCLLIRRVENDLTQLRQTDIVFQTSDVTAFIATRKFPNNTGHVLIIPNVHYENIYDLPLEISAKVHALSRDVALAMKSEYRCDGIMLRQHNEPGGDQYIWHYHLHVIPRYHNDKFHKAEKIPFDVEERAGYARKLKVWLDRL